MSGVLTLSNSDLLILRDVASQYYLQAGHDSDAMNSVGKLISGSLGMLQPSLFFQVHSTPITGFWTITTVATGKWLKVDTSASGNQNKLTWVDTNPSADFVIDKSPFYFSFTQVPGYDSPTLYVLGTYHNGGMTLQQPEGAGSDPVFALPQAIPGTTPEISFEVTVPEQPPANLGKQALLALDLNSPMVGANDASSGGQMVGAASVSSSSTSNGGVDGWAVAFIVLISVLALIALGYGLYMLWKYYTRGVTRQRVAYVAPAPGEPAAVAAVSVAAAPPAAAVAVVGAEAPPPPPPAEEAPPPPPPLEEAAKGGRTAKRPAATFLPYGGHAPPPPVSFYAEYNRYGGASLPTIPSSTIQLNNPLAF